MVRVSVVIPVFDVCVYLPRCLDSVLAQTFSDFEVLCVDDGSTDGSADVLSAYANIDDRITVLTQLNRGLGYSRNLGVRVAAGEFVYFLDSDDYIAQNLLESCVSWMDRAGLDLLFFSGTPFFDPPSLASQFPGYRDMYQRRKPYGPGRGRDLLSCLLDDGAYFSSACMQFARRNYLLSHDLRFQENMLFEDGPYTLEAILRAQAVYVSDEALYLRRVRDGSIMTTSANVDPLNRLRDQVTSARLLWDIGSSVGLGPDLCRRIFKLALGMLKQPFRTILGSARMAIRALPILARAGVSGVRYIMTACRSGTACDATGR